MLPFHDGDYTSFTAKKQPSNGCSCVLIPERERDSGAAYSGAVIPDAYCRPTQKKRTGCITWVMQPVRFFFTVPEAWSPDQHKGPGLTPALYS